jgi:hypothetical protein
MKAKQDNVEVKQEQARRHVPYGYFVAGAILLLLGGAVGWVQWRYHDRALPHIFVGGVAVDGMAYDDIAKAVQQQLASLTVTFKDGDAATTVPIKDLGVSVDTDATARQALLARRGPDIVQNFSLWQPQTIPFVYSNDAGILKAYIVQHFPKVYVDPQDAQLTFNDTAKQFDMQPATGLILKASS